MGKRDKEVIAEWKDCYIDYQTLKILLKQLQISSCKRLQRQKLLIKNEGEQNIDQIDDLQNNNQENQVPETQTYLSIKQQNQKADTQFRQTFQKQLQTFEQFTNYKLTEIQIRYNKASKYFVMVKQQQNLQKQKLLPFIQGLYIHIVKLLQMYKSNLEIQEKIVVEYRKYTYGYFQLLEENRVNNRFDIKRCVSLMRSIQQLYVKSNTQTVSNSRAKLRQLSTQLRRNQGDHFMVGIMMGLSMAILVFLIIIPLYFRNQGQISAIFRYDFPLWGGVIILLLYNWILGINFYHFRKYNINYVNVLQFQPTKYTSAMSFFKPAAFFAIVTIILFLLYTLDITNFSSVKTFNPQLLPLFIWIPYGFYVLNPISMFYFKSRTYLVKIIIQCLISFAIPIRFPISYASEQFTSLFVPVHAAFFSSCYYTRFVSTSDNQQSLQSLGYECYFPTNIAIFVFTILIFIIIIVQCIKLSFQQKRSRKVHLANSLKYLSALITSILAFSLNMSNKDVLLPIWIIFTILTVIYSSFWDIKFDWQLFQTVENKNSLRNRLNYSRIFYYCVIAVNLILRMCWVFTISTNIITNYFAGPQMCIFVFSFIEIIRRGVWNMLSIQAQHVKNCKNLCTVPVSFIQLDAYIYDQLINSKSQSVVSLQRLQDPDQGQGQGQESLQWQSTKQRQHKQNFYKIIQKVQDKLQHNKNLAKNAQVQYQNNIQIIDYLFKYQ